MGKQSKTRVTLSTLTSTLSEMQTVEKSLTKLYSKHRLEDSHKVKALEDKLIALDDLVAQASDRTWDAYLSSTSSTTEEV